MKVLNSGKALVLAVLAVMMANFAYAQPANDGCAGAIALTCGSTITASNATATNDDVPACGLSAPRKGVWYTITGTGGLITLSTCSATTNFDTQIAVYTGTCGAATLTCVTANDNDAACTNFFNRLSTVSFTSTFGTVYRVMVAGKAGASGTFTLSTTCASIAPPNDLCTGAIALACGGSVSGSTAGATADANAGTCTTALNTAPGVWFTVVGNGGDITVSTCNPGTDFDTKLGVFSGTCAGLVCVGGNDDTTAPECVLPATGFNRKSRVTFTSVNGTTYYVLVTGFSTAVGNFQLTATCAAPPVTFTFNECQGALTLTPGATCVTTAGTTVGATQSIAPITCGIFTSTSSLDVWYKFVATQANHVVIANGGTTFDIIIDVRSGACNGTNIGCADAQVLSGAAEVVSLTGLTAGQTYYVRLYGWAGSTGAFTVCVTNGATSLVDGSQGGVVAQNVDHLNVGDFYPNPTQSGQAFMDIFAPQESAASIQLFDQAGRVVRNMETELYAGINKVELNVNNLAKGTYFAAIRVNNEVFRKKLVVIQ